MCVVGHSTHYPRGSSWEIDISPSRVVTDVKTAVQRNWVARAYVSIGVPPGWDSRLNHSVGVPLRVWL